MKRPPINPQAKTALLHWMQSVLAERGWSAEQWAVTAGVSGTTITRFLKDQRFIPSLTTISALSSVVTQPPPDLLHGIGGAASFPLLSAKELIKMSEAPTQGLEYKKEISFPTKQSRSDAFCVVIEDTAMTSYGILRGDTLLCRPLRQQPPVPGDVVIVIQDDSISARLYMRGGTLMAAEPGWPPLSASLTTLHGVALELHRIISD